ncbi:MAG: hypothetical protein ACRYGG_12280, partial [Janthinobacterium lividum]
MAAPKVSSVAKAEAKQAKSYFKPSLSKIETKIPKTYSEITNLQKEFTGGNIRTSVFNKSLSQFYASGAKESIQDMSVNQLRVRLYGDPTGVNMASRTRYLENVVHAESLKHLPTAELVNYNRQLVAPSIGLNGVRDMVEKQIANGNAPFVRAMNFHMQKMEGMKYSGFAGIAKTADEVFMSTDVVKPKTLFNSWNDAKGALSTQRPDLFAAINKQIESGAIDLESFSVVRSNSALNPIIGLKLGDLNVPVVGNHGRILGGKDWSSTGVSRGVFVGKRKMLSDVYAVEHIGHGAVKIEKELSAINIISGVDNLDTWDNGARNIAAASDLQASLISKKYVGSNLLGFGQDGTKGYDAQTSREMETTVEHLESAGLMKAGSEKMGRVFEDREMARASYAGMQNPSRQNQYIRAFTKDTTLTNIKSTYKNRPYMMSDMFGELAGDAGVPVVGVTEGGVSAAQRTFFSQLPSTVEELHTYENEAIKILQNRHGLEERQARGSWKHLSEWLAKDDNLAVMRKSEALGEGSKIAVRNGMNITRTRNFSVTEHALGDNPVIGSTLSPKDILGFSGGHPISADAKTNVLKQFTTNDDGTFTLTVDENQKFGKGAKIDLFTRGLVGEDLSREEGKVFANGLSRYNIATGSGPAISSENTIFGLIGSEAAKGDPVDTTLKLAAGTIREMADMDQPVLVDKYTKLLGERGIDIAKGTFDSSSFPGLTNIQSRGEFSKTRKIVEDLMTEAGDRIRDLAISQPHKLNETGRNFAATSRSSSFGNLEEFLLTSKAYGDMTAWDHTAFNAPKKVGITYDIFQDLSVSGHHGAIKDIKSRLEYDGDAAMTRDVASFMSGEDTIPTRMSMRDALGTKTRNIKLHTAEGRIGSIFDMDHPQAKSNFIVDLPDGSSLPVLGHDAYGGRSNRFGA